MERGYVPLVMTTRHRPNSGIWRCSLWLLYITEVWQGGLADCDGQSVQVHLHKRLDRSYPDPSDTVPHLLPRAAWPLVRGSRPHADVTSTRQCDAFRHPNAGTDLRSASVGSFIGSAVTSGQQLAAALADLNHGNFNNW